MQIVRILLMSCDCLLGGLPWMYLYKVCSVRSWKTVLEARYYWMSMQVCLFYWVTVPHLRYSMTLHLAGGRAKEGHWCWRGYSADILKVCGDRLNRRWVLLQLRKDRSGIPQSGLNPSMLSSSSMHLLYCWNVLLIINVQVMSFLLFQE